VPDWAHIGAIFHKPVPGLAAGVEDVLVGVEDAVRQPVLAQILPDVLDRVIDRAIMGAPAHRTCRSLEYYIEAVAERILAWERAYQMHFDRTDRPIMLRGGS
jgi:hypothetical protein